MDKAEHIFSISYSEKEEERMALFSSTSNSAGKVYDYMMKNFPFKYKDPSDFKEQKETKPDDQIDSGSRFSVADELQKLAELKKAGVLTNEEFEKQKQKLLNHGI